MGEDLPFGGLTFLRHALGVDGDNDALRAEFLGRLAHEIRVGDGGGVDRHLVGTGQQQLAHIFHRAHTAADSQRHEAALRRAAHHVDERTALFVAGRDVEEAELIRARRVIGGGGLDRVARIAQVNEIDALDDAAVLHVQAGNDTGLEAHAASFRTASASAGSRRPS